MPTSYDETPYPSLSYVQSHPDRLATVATLLGLHPAPVSQCRVLELGCAGGGNLIPMAYGLPQSSFVGIDNSARQIADGKAMLAALGMDNVSLHHMDILEVGGDLGTFDYIIAHGVFSWVPQDVQEKVLGICKTHLAPHGVAYVSYNTYPGWHSLGAIREMMLYHTRGITAPLERAAQARALLDLLSEAVPADKGAYGVFLHSYVQFLRGELEGHRTRGDAFLLHDELEEVNDPIYFFQFADRAARHGLQYLGEAEFSTMMGDRFDPEAFQRLDAMVGSVIELEQYIDFFDNRTFRRTLLCHQGVEVSRTLDPRRLSTLYACARAQPAEPIGEVDSGEVVQFRSSDGATLSTDHPITKAAMLYLAMIWPRAVNIDELLELAQAHARRGGSPRVSDIAQDTLVLCTNLLKAYAYSSSLVELHVHAPSLSLSAGEQPIASALARYQSRGGSLATNLRHERVQLEPSDRALMTSLDGEHDRSALVEALQDGPVAQGILVVQREGETVQDVTEKRELLAEGLEQRLQWLARAALLEE